MLEILFRWPKTIESPDLITVVGWHQTPNLQKVGYTLTAMTGLAMIVNPFFGYSSLINRIVVTTIHFVYPQWLPSDIAACWLIIQFFLGLAIAGLGSDKKLNLFALLLRTRTVVKIAADRVEILGTPYPRSTAKDVHFVTTSDAVRMENGQGESMIMGSIEESNCLRLAYGRSNTAIVANFLKPTHASRFALACNSALQSTIFEMARGFEVLNVVPLDDEPRQGSPLPVRVSARRRRQ